MSNEKISKDASAEEKIMQAARVVFTQKGYAATRTRDIAEAAGINLALLNYYYRSKENLFSLVMAEKMQMMLGVIAGVLNNRETSLIEKVEMAVEKYFFVLSANPDLPIFVLSEIQKNPEVLRERIQVSKLIKESHFAQQLKEQREDINPLQMILNLLGMVIFPFVIKPLLLGTGPLADKAFAALLKERRQLVPIWFEACLKA